MSGELGETGLEKPISEAYPTLDTRYLRKDANDNNSTYTLTVGQLISDTGIINYSGIDQFSYGDGTNFCSFYGYTARGTQGSPEASQDGDLIQICGATGHDGTSFPPTGGEIYFLVNGTVSTGIVPMGISFNITDAFGVFKQVGAFNSDGNFYLEGDLVTNAKLSIIETGTTPEFYSTFQGGDQTSNITYTLPGTTGGAGTVLTDSSGNGILNWVVGSTGGGAGLVDGDYGDITVGGTGTTMVVNTTAIGYAKIQNVSASDKLLGRISAGAGVVEEVVCTDAGQALLDDATAADQCTTLGLGTGDGPTFDHLHVTNQGDFTTVLADHIGEFTGSHGVVFDNVVDVSVGGINGTVHSIAFPLPGTLSTGTNKLGAQIIVPFACTIVKARANVGTTSTGASIIFDVKYDANGGADGGGTTIWSTTGNRLTLGAGTAIANTVTFDTTSLAAGGTLTLDIVQATTGTAAATNGCVLLVVRKAGAY